LTVRAPIGGQVLSIKARAGEYYNPLGAEPLLIIGDTSKLRVRMDVDERDVAKVVAGATGFATLSAYPGKKFPTHVVEIGKRMGRKNIRTDDPVERIDTKILEVLLEVDGNEGLVPGLRVTSFIEIK
jgi:HlyD family secretion protein